MRFSLKWILAAVVYVAIAAAAFSQQSWVYADILWAMSLLAIVFAALLAFLARGKGRVMAAGFLAASVCYLACLAFGQTNGSDVIPTTRLLIASGYDPNSAFRPATIYPLAGTNTWQAAPMVSGTLTLQPPPATSPLTRFIAPRIAPTTIVATPVAGVADFAMYMRAANSVGTMLFGVLGIVVGLFALKRVSHPNRGD